MQRVVEMVVGKDIMERSCEGDGVSDEDGGGNVEGINHS